MLLEGTNLQISAIQHEITTGILVLCGCVVIVKFSCIILPLPSRGLESLTLTTVLKSRVQQGYGQAVDRATYSSVGSTIPPAPLPPDLFQREKSIASVFDTAPTAERQ